MRRFLKYGYVSFSKERGAKDLGFRFVSSFNVTSKKYLLMHFKPLPAKLTYFGYNSYTKLILMKKFKKIILTGARDGGTFYSGLWSGIWLCRSRVFLWRLFFMVCLGSVGKFWMDECLEVKVSGSWLKDFGFEYGHKVVVEVTKGQIVIKAVHIEDMDAVEGEEV